MLDVLMAYRWLFQNRGDPLRDPSGRILRWYNLLIDIEERKRAEKALRESEERFRDYAETASDWFWEIGSGPQIHAADRECVWLHAHGSNRHGVWDHALDLETEPEKWRLIQAPRFTQTVP